MPDRFPKPAAGRRRRGASAAIGALALLTALLTAASVWAAFVYYPLRLGPAQPLPFSHRFHAGEKGISCFFCHPDAATGRRAGIPPLETCMLCHERIIITHPEIKRLRAHYFDRRPIAWAQVYDVPEFVYFDHEAHVRRQVDCGACHGNVQAMDRVRVAHEFTMGFCVQCHRDHQASHDCYVCHR